MFCFEFSTPRKLSLGLFTPVAHHLCQVLDFFEYALQVNARFTLKTDDDTFVFIDRLLMELQVRCCRVSPLWFTARIHGPGELCSPGGHFSQSILHATAESSCLLTGRACPLLAYIGEAASAVFCRHGSKFMVTRANLYMLLRLRL